MKRRGFTLVELLVVVGIIAVLLAIMLPALNKARRAAQSVQCASNLRQLVMGVHQYANANRGYLIHPYAVNPTTAWHETLAVYMKPKGYISSTIDNRHYTNVFLCPSDPSPTYDSYTKREFISYGYNYATVNLSSPLTPKPNMKLSQMRQASETLCIVDHYPSGGYFYPPWGSSYCGFAYRHGAVRAGKQLADFSWCQGGDRMNAGMMDGSVQTYAIDDKIITRNSINPYPIFRGYP